MNTANPKPSMLIVEDFDILRASLLRWLAALYPDWQFLEARSGEEALEVAGKHSPDLVLMDFQMPGMSGPEATRRLRETLPSIQVVIMTLNDAPDYRRDAEQAGAIAFVSKANMDDELIPTLNKLMLADAVSG